MSKKTQKGGWRIRSPLQSGILSFITRKRIRQRGKKLSRLYRIHTERAMLLFAGCKGKKLRPAQFLSVLKEKGLYPFCPVGFQLIPCSDLKTTLCNWLTFGFFFRPYFFLSAGACSLNKRCRRAKPPPGAFMCFHGGFFMSCRGSAALQQIKANRCFFWRAAGGCGILQFFAPQFVSIGDFVYALHING